MKNLITLLMACAFCAGHFSFSQEPIYNWGKPSTNDNLERQVDQILSLEEKGFVILRKHTDHMFVNHYFIESYDENLSLIQIQPIDFNVGVMGNSYFIEDIQVANGTIYAFVSHWVKAESSHSLILHELSLDGSLTEVMTLDNITAQKLGNKGFFQISFSPDGSKLLVLSEQAFVKKTNEKLKLTCYETSSMKEMWSQEQTLNWPSKRAYNNYIQVNDNGEAMLFKRKWDKPIWKYEIYTAGSDGSWNLNSDLDLEGKEVVDYQLAVDSDNNHILFGLYTTKPSAFERNVHGSCFYKVGSDQKLSSKVVPNDMELLSYFVGEKRANSGKGAISDLTIKDILFRNDGGTMVVMEQQKEDDKPIPGSSPIKYNYEYTYGDFVTFNLTPSGDLNWWQAFSKNQKVTNTTGVDEYGSYVYYLKNDRLHILWNNTELSIPSIPPASWQEPDGTKYVKHKAFNEKTMHATFLEVIEPDGRMAFEDRTFGLPLFNMHDGAVFEMSMTTNFSFSLNNDLVIMAAMHNGGKRYRFGLVGL